MKRLILPVILSVFILSNVCGQSVISVPRGQNYIYQALDYAIDGDIIELTESGVYLLDSLLIIDKTLTFRAAQGLESKPILKNVNPTLTTRFLFEIQTGGNLTLKGLDLDGISDSDTPAKYIIKTAETVDGLYNLFVDDCILHDVNTGDETGNFFRAYLYTHADSVVFRNCVLYNSGREGIRIKETDNTVNYFEISNSTMHTTGHEGIYVQGDQVKFRVNYCTFDNLGYLHHDMIRPRFVVDAVIKNSIFSNVPEPQTRALLIYGPSTLDYCDFYKVGVVDIHDQSAINLGEHVLYDVDPKYANWALGDFSLLPTSPLINYAENGGPLGDPNAVNNKPDIPAVIQVGLSRNALYDSLLVAEEGDILELSDSGDYLLDSLLYIDKTITLRAAQGLETKPVLKNVNPNLTTRFLFEIETGGNLILNGLDLDGIADSETPAKYLIKTADEVEGTYKLRVEDCVLHDVVSGSDGNFFRGYSDTYADSVIFRNCVLFNSGKEGIRIKDADNTVNYFEIINSTIYNTQAEGIYIQGDAVVFRVDHCTFDSLGIDNTHMIRPAYVRDAEVKNTIFSNTPEPHTTSILFYGPSSIEYCDFYRVGSISASDPAEFRFGDNVWFGVNPDYADQPNADFTLLKTSEMFYAANDGQALGDLRWATNPSQEFSVIPVAATQNSIYDALMSASFGDTLELTESGDYLLDSLLYIDKTITVRAAESLETKPVLKFVNPDITTRFIFEIQTGGNLTLQGLDLDGMAGSNTTANYLIRTDEEIIGLYNLFVEDCVLHDVVPNNTSGNFFRAYSKAYADTVIFSDCILYNSGKEGIRIKDADNTVNYFEITNCTMYDTNTEGIYIQGGEVVFRVNHCIFNNCGKYGAESVRPRYIVDAEIKNTVFSNTPEPHNRLMLLYGSSVLDYCDFCNVGSILIHDSSAHVSGEHNLFDIDPQYEDVASANFTLLETSPLYKMADDGEAIGDLRWATNEPATSISESNSSEKEFKLAQNYPNPFNPQTTIRFDLIMAGHTTVKIFNVLGQEVVTLLNKEMQAGSHNVIFKNSALPSGIYFYKIKSGKFSAIKKMMLLK